MITNLLKYKEENVTNFINEYIEYHENKKGTENRKKLKKADSSYSSNVVLDHNEIISEYKENIKDINKAIEINQSTKRDNIRVEKLNEELELLIKDLKAILKVQSKKIYQSDNIVKFLSNLKSSADKNTGTKSKPLTINFANLISRRLQFVHYNLKLREYLENFNSETTIKLGNLPGKGNVSLLVKLEVMNEKSVSSAGGFNKTRITLNRNLVQKLLEFSPKNFKIINSYFNVDEREVDVGLFVNDIILRTSKIQTNLNKDYEPSEGEKAILSITAILENYNYDVYIFDEIERGLGNKYITEYVIPQINKLVHAGKTVIISTHNANLAINSLPINFVYCDYISDDQEIYYFGNMFNNKLEGIKSQRHLNWEIKALKHLEGSDEMFKRRKNIYGI